MPPRPRNIKTIPPRVPRSDRMVFGFPREARPLGSRRRKATAPSVAAEAKTDYTAVKNNLLMRIFWTQHK